MSSTGCDFSPHLFRRSVIANSFSCEAEAANAFWNITRLQQKTENIFQRSHVLG